MRLEEVLEKNELVLIDSSIINFQSKTLEPIKHFGEIAPDNLLKIMDNIRESREVFSHPSAATIPEITEEIKRLRYITGEKIKSITINSRHIPKRYNKTSKYSDIDINRELHEFHEQVNKLYISSKRKEIYIRDPRFNALQNIIIDLDNQIKIRYDKSLFHKAGERVIENTNYTDDKIVATYYWLTLMGKQPLIASADSHLAHFLKIINPILGARDFHKYNQEFIKNLIKREHQLYLKRNGQMEPRIKNKLYDFNFFPIRCLSKEQNDAFRQKITEFYQSLQLN
jgi:hypothetical protein